MLLETFANNFNQYHRKVALEFIDPPLQRLTYGELDQAVARTVSYLQSLGLSPGNRVALQLPKCLEFILPGLFLLPSVRRHYARDM